MERIENLEKRRDDLHKEEMKADSRCDEVSQFLLSNLGSYMLMRGFFFSGSYLSWSSDSACCYVHSWLWDMCISIPQQDQKNGMGF